MPPDFTPTSRTGLPVDPTILPHTGPRVRRVAGTVACERFLVLMNVGSGSSEKDQVRQEILDAISAAGGEASIVELKPGTSLDKTIERAVSEAKRTGAILVAAGGDGTLNTVAAHCCRHMIPMGMIPLGTFNYLARALDLPLNPAEAAAALVGGRLRTIHVGYLNNQLFINNASFGLYTNIIRRREAHKSRFGRFRIVALLSAIVTLIRGQRPFAIRIVTPEGVQVRRTTTVFVCNNVFQLENLGLQQTECVKSGRLAVALLKPLRRFDAARLLWRGLTRALSDESKLEQFCAQLFSVDSRRRVVDVVVDGEVVRCTTPLSFRVAHDALQVVVPGDAVQ